MHQLSMLGKLMLAACLVSSLAASTSAARTSAQLHEAPSILPKGAKGSADAPAPAGPPDDATLDALFDVPAVARTIVAARADGEPPEDAQPLLGPVEIWAKARRWRRFDANHTAAVLANLSGGEVAAIRSLCGRCLYHTLNYDVAVHNNGQEHVFVATGDIDAEWLRDSAVQLAIYLPRIAAHPFIRPVIEGAIRSQAYWILYDPHANAFNRAWRTTDSFSPSDRRVAKGGWIWEHKFEVDSGAYFFNLLWNYFSTPGLFDPKQLFSDVTIHDAVVLLLRTWQLEQRHETDSTYRFASELPRGGKGSKSNYTGLIWGGFRPSDDGQKYGFNIPANMYAAGALRRLLQLNGATWQSSEVQRRATRLLADIRKGLARWAMARAPDGSTVYAYEVDGLGNQLVDFDDPNLPSLLAMPLLGYEEYDRQAYAATRRRILSPANPYYVTGRNFTGLTSPHTPARYIWPLAHMVDALTTEPTAEGAVHQASLMRDLLAMQCGNGLMHESVDANDPAACTRPIFEWSNAMLVVAAEQLLDLDCAAAAEEEELRATLRREWDASKGPGGGIAPSLLEYYRRPEAHVPHEPLVQQPSGTIEATVKVEAGFPADSAVQYVLWRAGVTGGYRDARYADQKEEGGLRVVQFELNDEEQREQLFRASLRQMGREDDEAAPAVAAGRPGAKAAGAGGRPRAEWTRGAAWVGLRALRSRG